LVKNRQEHSKPRPPCYRQMDPAGTHGTPEERHRTFEIVQKIGRAGAIGQHVREIPPAPVHEPVMRRAETLSFRFDRNLKNIATHPMFETAFGLCIFVNGLIMCLEMQHNGFDIGHDMPYISTYASSEETWPGGGRTFEACTFAFGVIFTAELVIKIICLRIDFVKSLWNWFDTVVVGFWLSEETGLADLLFNPNFLRLMRLLRLLRLMRLVKKMHAMDSLQVLVGSIKACAIVAFWSATVLAMIFVLAGFILNASVEAFMKNEDNSLEARRAVFGYFGTFTRTFLTMYELSLGNWAPCTRLLVEEVNEFYTGFILLFRYLVGFAMVRVMTGVFLHETFQVAALDDDLMVVQKARMISRYQEKMSTFMKVADDSDDGIIERAEFISALSQKQVRTWVAAMDLEVGDLDVLFDFLDSDDGGGLTQPELVAGFTRLKGPARSIDVIGLTYKIAYLQDHIADLTENVDWLCRSYSESNRHIKPNVFAV